ncbi:hypothetical protein BG36_14830 [Aquamicrobium defluvii]|nr:hypothetical protein BG36_14830 [Aquamicrobium defluvii]EZQ13149.1 hypothetical protein CF98_29860 [Halopseudomonas bauzanensis]
MLSHAGPMPLSARDSALLFNITKGPDPLDHQALPDDQADHTDTHPIQSLRIGLAPSLFGFPVAPEIDCGVRRVITAPRGSANMFVTDRRPPENIVEAVRAEELEIICA